MPIDEPPKPPVAPAMPPPPAPWVPHPPPPPERPELPEGADPSPRWPAWHAPLALVSGVVATLVIVFLVDLFAQLGGRRLGSPSPALTAVLTVVQDAVFVAVAIAFAALTRRPRPWHFGLRGRRLGPTAGWALLGLVTFYVISIAYTVALHPHGKQTVTRDLGVNRSELALVAGAFLVIVVAPIAEEFFFRGFFYRALRSRLGIWAAAVIDGLVFGLVHYTGHGTLTVLPVLAVLGLIFCLVYERTGTLYSTIALHAINNAVAYSAETSRGGRVAGIFGLAMVVAAAVATATSPPGGRLSRGLLASRT